MVVLSLCLVVMIAACSAPNEGNGTTEVTTTDTYTLENEEPTTAPADETETTTPADAEETTTPADENETTTPADEDETTTPADEVETTTPPVADDEELRDPALPDDFEPLP